MRPHQLFPAVSLHTDQPQIIPETLAQGLSFPGQGVHDWENHFVAF